MAVRLNYKGKEKKATFVFHEKLFEFVAGYPG
jgi:hypothetical protein